MSSGWEIASTIANIAVAITALAACIIGFYQWNEQRKMRLAQMDPCVVVRVRQLQPDASYDVLCIENIGTSPAFSVRFDLSDRDKDLLTKLLSANLDWLSQGLPVLGPGESLQFMLIPKYFTLLGTQGTILVKTKYLRSRLGQELEMDNLISASRASDCLLMPVGEFRNNKSLVESLVNSLDRLTVAISSRDRL